MDAKCSKCDGEKFTIKKREDKAYCYVICSECGTIAGVLEDIDFKAHHNHVIKNHGFFEKRFNDLEEQIKKIDKREQIIQETYEMLCDVNRKIR